MEDKLKTIVTKIEQSDMTEEEKADLYGALSESLQAVVLPVLFRYMPPDKVTRFTENPDEITVESYGSLIEESIKDPQALKDVETTIDRLLVEINGLLAKEGIV